MFKKPIMTVVLASFMALISCSDDDGGGNLIDFTVSFNNGSVGLLETDASKEIALTFSRAAAEAGTINISFTGENAAYGTDFTTDPAASSGSLSLPVAVGATGASFTFNKLEDPVEGTTKSVSFTLGGFSNTDWKNGSTPSTVVSFTPVPASSGLIDAEMGGPNQPNMVFVDLSTGQQSKVRRDAWEIAFYNGAENRVFLNSALLVSAAEITGATDINEVNETTVLAEPMLLKSFNISTNQTDDVTVTNVADLLVGLPIGYGQYGNQEEGISFTDNLAGTLDGTAFTPISTTAGENYVYIVSLGASIPDSNPNPGSIATTGEHRGFMKVRVLSDGDSYTLQYAELDATTFSEVTIAKDATKNLTAFSLVEGGTVEVEPASTSWDIQFPSVFSYYGPFGGTVAGLTLSDYAIHNTLGGVGLYMVLTSAEGAPTYANFARNNVDESALVYDNRAVIGSDWRATSFTPGTLPSVRDDRYYVIKDADGNFYKLRFTGLLNALGERGFPQFIYERL